MSTESNKPGVLAPETSGPARKAENAGVAAPHHHSISARDESERHRVRVRHRRRLMRMPWSRERNGLLWLLLTLAIAAIMAYSMLHYLELL